MWQKGAIILGGVLAVIAQWVPNYYLALIGGILALLGALVPAQQ